MSKKLEIVSNWRNKRLHRRCVFCTFCHLLPQFPVFPEVWYCDCKEKSVNPTITRPFCKCFMLDEELINKIKE